jgi:hypothetical protein
MEAPVKDEHSEVTRWSLLNCQVCSDLSEDEALEWVKKAMPAGTSGNWGRSDVGAIDCANGNGRKHYVYQC